MENFKSPAEIDPNSKEQIKINKLWLKYKCKGNPPKFGTPVYKRLEDTCKNYIDLVINPVANRMSGSDSLRRKHHNDIAVMVDGGLREGMRPQRAEEISDFASMLVYGVEMNDLDDLYQESQNNS